MARGALSAIQRRASGWPVWSRQKLYGSSACGIQGPISVFDLTEVQELADPQPFYQGMRESDPVHWSDEFRAWFVTGYPEVSEALRNPHLSNARTSRVPDRLKAIDPDLFKDYRRVMSKALFMTDPPEHTRLRRQSGEAFTPAAVDGWRAVIQSVVDACLDRAEAGGRIDLVKDFAEVVPATVLGEMFDVPRSDQQLFCEGGVAVATLFRSPTTEVEARAKAGNDATLALERYFLDLIPRRRERPGNDLVSFLIGKVEEGKMTEEELSAQCVSFLAAGIVTTAEQLGNGAYCFLADPSTIRALQADESLIKTAAQEVLRYAAGGFIFKVASQQTEIAGTTIEAEQIVYLGLSPANRDARVFDDPHRFDIQRENAHRHLAFGLGRHACTGSALATAELEIAFQTLFRRFPRIRLDTTRELPMKWDAFSPRIYTSLPAII